MTVEELIKKLEKCQDKGMEVGFQVERISCELLIGEDGNDKNSSSITISKPEWC